MSENPQLSQESTPVCAACGKENRSGARFCRDCGMAFGASKQESTESSALSLDQVEEFSDAIIQSYSLSAMAAKRALKTGDLSTARQLWVDATTKFNSQVAALRTKIGQASSEILEELSDLLADKQDIDAGFGLNNFTSAESSGSSEKLLVCAACGKENRSGARFCRECGASLS
ncbi:MAG: hypothetical protein COU68_04480 [Candidatus Pacebacteria bacterium CG10_big_fil_rev_8_21_14_0_10_45_6]|nr:MAG: hypothetical protein COU68_04480 [Candidatus Pacebacteria bacterium CG10_big_fil_rev_8_21_14_0_10_45_6]